MRASAWANAAGWGTLGVLALLASGGAASAPEGILLGAPSLSTLGVVVAGLALLGALASGTRAPAACAGLALVPLLVLLGLHTAGLPALTGPPLYALLLAGVALVLAETHLPVARVLFFPVVLALYLGVAARVQEQVGAEGDEPHYLMVADSLLRDGDLSLERDYALGRYRAFHPGDLAPHYRVRGAGGEIYSLHALGLSLLVLPAYAVGGYPAASFFMALLAALLALEIRGLLREALGEGSLAEGVAWLVALSPPLVHYAGLIFTEVPAALAVAALLRRGRTAGETRPLAALGLGTAIGFLPWLNVRYAVLAVLLLAYALANLPRRRTAAALVAPALFSAVAIAAYHHALYGFFDPRRVYGARPELSLANLPEGLQGLLLDQEFGLLVYAPIFVLAVPGLAWFLGERRRLTLACIALVAAVLVIAGEWPMWRGGWNPPARFLVPVLPALALGVAARLRNGLTPGAALLLGWGLWTGLAGAAEPRLVHRDRDGTAPLFRANSGAEEWTRLLPGYVLADPERRRLALVWGVALVLAATRWRRSPASATAVAISALGLVAAVAAASAPSHVRTGGRDAVRLLGRPSLLVPAWLVDAPPARWGPASLDWGPLYEPHRHPDGAEIASRIAIPPGAYLLRVEGEDLAAEHPATVLQVRPEGPGGAAREHFFETTPAGLVARFECRPGERALSLALRGGGTFLVRSLVLIPQPFPGRPV